MTHSNSHEHMTSVVERYAAGFADGDAVALANLYADDATLEDPVGTPLTIGQAAILHHYTKAVESGSTIRIDGPIRTSNDHAAFAFTSPIGTDGTSIAVIDTFRFGADGKVIEMRAFWSVANIVGPG